MSEGELWLSEKTTSQKEEWAAGPRHEHITSLL